MGDAPGMGADDGAYQLQATQERTSAGSRQPISVGRSLEVRHRDSTQAHIHTCAHSGTRKGAEEAFPDLSWHPWHPATTLVLTRACVQIVLLATTTEQRFKLPHRPSRQLSAV